MLGSSVGDTTTIHQTLAEAGDAVAELIEHEVATAPAEEPKVHLGGVEARGTGKGNRTSRSRCMPTGGGLEESAAKNCSGPAVN
jgi:hypothetical protein